MVETKKRKSTDRRKLTKEEREAKLKRSFLKTLAQGLLHVNLALDKHKIPKSVFQEWMEDPIFSTNVYKAHAIAVELAADQLEKKDKLNYIQGDEYFFDLGDGDV